MIEKSKFYYYTFFILFWFLAVWAFIAQEVLMIGGLLEGPVRLVTDAVVMVVGLMALRDKRDIWILVSFFLLSFISSIVINGESAVTYFNGVREYVGLVFLAPIVRYLFTSNIRERFIQTFDRAILIFLVLQLITIPYQAMKYGVGDHGGGTLGDGLSGSISTLIYMGTFYLLSRRWNFDDFMGSFLKNKAYFLLLVPSFLNETKISFFYLLIFCLLLFPVKIKSVFKIIAAAPFIAVLFGVLAYFYLTVTNAYAAKYLDADFYQAYIFGDDGDRLLEFADRFENDEYYELESEWDLDFPRFFKIGHIPAMLEQTKGGVLFGAGNGQLKGGSMIEKTEFARKNEIWFLGTIPLIFDLMVQMGLLGTIWFFVNILTVLKFKNVPRPMDLNVKLLIASFIFLQLFYGTLFTYIIVDMFLFYIAFRCCHLKDEHGRTLGEEIEYEEEKLLS